MILIRLIQNLEGLNMYQFVLYILAYLGAIVFAIVVHEIAHGYMALACGDNTAKYYGRLTLNPAAHFNLMGFLMFLIVGFGYAKPVPIDPRNFKHYKKDSILVSLAGILTNILMAFFFTLIVMLIDKYQPTFTSMTFWYYALYFVYIFSTVFVLINLNLALFNILPLFPLDGYRFIECFVGSENRFMIFMRRYSMPILLVLILVGSINSNFSPLTWYIYLGQSGLSKLFRAFWGLFGL